MTGHSAAKICGSGGMGGGKVHTSLFLSCTVVGSILHPRWQFCSWIIGGIVDKLQAKLNFN